MEFKYLKYEIGGAVGTLTLNRPERLNAVNQEMWEELIAFHHERMKDFETRVIILTGAGRGFCAGLDMKDSALLNPSAGMNYDAKRAYEEQSYGSELLALMRRIPQPIIAAVNGPAAGAGFSFALASDVRLAVPGAKFVAAYINVGVGGADLGSSWIFPRMVGMGNAARYLLTGDAFDSAEAYRMGLVQEIVEPDKLMDSARALAAKMVSKSALGLRLTKEALTRNFGGPSLEDAIHLEDRNQALCIAQLIEQASRAARS